MNRVEIGKTYGNLMVLAKAKSLGRRRRFSCVCLCSEATKLEIEGRALFSLTFPSCGCVKRIGPGRKSSGQGGFTYLLCRYRFSAKRKGLAFELKAEDFKKLTSSPCHYCGSLPALKSQQKQGFGAYIYNGIDRVDNAEGYTVENTVPCCRMCNVAKNTHSLQDFLAWIKNVYRKSYP